MSVTDAVENLLRAALLLAGLVVPGAMILRALRLPFSLAAAFAGSAATLYLLVIGYSAAGLGITLASVAAGLAIIAGAARLIPRRGPVAEAEPWHAGFTRLGGWAVLVALFWLIVGWRLGTQPLTGPDIGFRWSWLAEQIVRFGTLEFYPARSSEDFARYFWPESIPPGIASLYAWAYLCGGNTHALWTSPVVLLQLLALHELISRLGHQWGGKIVARRAVVLAAATPLLTWAVLIGQETGLTAMAVAGLAWTLVRSRAADGNRWIVLTGLFGLVAASTREYGPVFVLVVAVWFTFSGASRRSLGLLWLVFVPAALIWPARTWLLTGNPVYSLDVAGLFPVNAGFIAWQQVFHAPHADRISSLAGWQSLARYLLLWALPATVGLGVAAILLTRRQSGTPLLALLVLVTVTLWWLSLPYTAGGLFYSLRVLSPAIALLIVPAACGLTVWAPPKLTRTIPAALALLLAESLPKTLVLPQNPYRAALRQWSSAGKEFSAGLDQRDAALLRALQALPDIRRVLTDTPSFQRSFAAAGITVVPPWSPEAAWLFDRALSPEERARRQQDSGLRLLVLGQSPSGVGFVLPRVHPTNQPTVLREAEGNLLVRVRADNLPPPSPAPK